MFTRKYFQDKPILFLNIAIILGVLINIISSYARIDTTKSVAIIRYEVAEGLAGFSRADTYELYSFAVASLIFALMAIFMSAKLYHQKRFMSVLLLSLTVIVLLFNFVVSNAIFNLQ